MWVDADSAELKDGEIEQALVRWPDGSESREHVGKLKGEAVIYCSHRGHLFSHAMADQGFQIEDGEPEAPEAPAEPPATGKPVNAPAKEATPQEAPAEAFTPNEEAEDPDSPSDGKPRRVKVSK